MRERSPRAAEPQDSRVLTFFILTIRHIKVASRIESGRTRPPHQPGQTSHRLLFIIFDRCVPRIHRSPEPCRIVRLAYVICSGVTKTDSLRDRSRRRHVRKGACIWALPRARTDLPLFIADYLRPTTSRRRTLSLEIRKNIMAAGCPTSDFLGSPLSSNFGCLGRKTSSATPTRDQS
jgi:hypothetical protein